MFRPLMTALSAVVLFTSAAYHGLGDEDLAAPAQHTSAAPPPAPAPAPPTDQAAPALEPDEVAQRVSDWHHFTEFSSDIVARAADGDLSLREARDQIIYYCLAHYPTHLEHLQMMNKGRSLKYNASAYLVRCVNSYLEEHDLGHLSTDVLPSLADDEPGHPAPTVH